MKKIKYRIIYLVVIVMLSACSADKSISVNANSSDAILMTSGMPTTVKMDSVQLNEMGYYDIISSDSGYNIMFTDYNTETQTYLCSSAGCLHNDENCTSFLASNHNSRTLLINENTEQLMVLGSKIDQNGIFVTEMDYDGTNRVELIAFEDSGLSVYGHIVEFENKLYIVGTKFNQFLDDKTNLYEIDLENKTVKEIEELEFGVNLVSVNDQYIYFDRIIFDENNVPIGEVFTFDLNSKKIVNTINYDTGYYEEQSLMPGYMNNYMYIMNFKMDSFERINLDTGEISVLNDSVNIESEAYVYHIDTMDNKLFYQTVIPSVDMAEPISNWYSISFETGEIKEQTLKYPSSNKSGTVYPLAEFGDNLLVVNDLIPVNITLYDKANVPYEVSTEFPSKAIMTKDDFYNNNPVYKEIENWF